MFSYHLELAIRSLRRNVVVTGLIVAAVGAGIGASMTVITTLVRMSGNPIPDKSSKLFVPQIDAWGPESRWSAGWGRSRTLTYRDAMALMRTHKGVRQAAMYRVSLNVNSVAGKSFQALGRATYGDFFAMFEVPFRSGAAWGQKEDNNRANVVVLSSKLADRMFPRVEAVGSTINLNGRDYKVLGVMRPWTPTPRFYDPSEAYGESEDIYLPLLTAVDRQLQNYGSSNCYEAPLPGWAAYIHSDCFWLQFWVELPTADQVRNYWTFLHSYAADQQRLGRFHRVPRVELRDVMEMLGSAHLVRPEVRANVMIGISFLIVCLVNAIGLMLAKFSGRAMELGVRRALGASRADIFLQCMTETALVGLLGGLLGLGLTVAGLSELRALRDVTSTDSAAGHLYSLDSGMVLVTVAIAVVATVCSGFYPALRASRIQPAWQLKVQ